VDADRTIRYDLAESPGVGFRVQSPPDPPVWQTAPPTVGLDVVGTYTFGYNLGYRDGVLAALPARPLVSGTADALAATTQATVGVLTGHTNGCRCSGCEHLRFVGLPDAAQALVSGTANRDDVVRVADEFMSRVLDNVGAFDGSNDEQRDRAYVRARLLALLGGDQDDHDDVPMSPSSGHDQDDDKDVTVHLPAEDVAFIRGFDPDRDRTATRADMVRVVEHLQAALASTQ